MRSRIAPILLEAMLIALGGPLAAATPAAAARAPLDEAAAARFAALALKCLHQEYPNHISHTLGGDADARAPLEGWLPKLHYPIGIGEHDQTAFSFGLMWDWAGVAGEQPMRGLLEDAAQRFYRQDRNCPLAYEPSGEDFISPCLAEADFLRRVLAPRAFASWLTRFLPQIPVGRAGARAAQRPGAPWLVPGVVTDRADPKLAHIDGLNLSRAWMLEGIAHGLPAHDARLPALTAAAARHRDAALPAVTGEHYEGGHWLGTFAVYVTSRAGLAQ